MKMMMMRCLFILLCLAGFPQIFGQNPTEFEQLVDELGLDENVVDLSESANFSLDEPRLAYANLTGISMIPRSKHSIEHAWLEVYDGAGHRFRDGSLKNWQWFTYDGKKWMVTPYDLDQCFGLGLYGQIRPSYFPIETLTSGPFYWLNAYYQNDICQRWQQLRQNGVLTGASLIPIADDWYTRVGDDFYLLERQHWPLSPCYCEPICNANWETYDNWENYRSTPDYSNKVTYVNGDVVKLEGRLWMATDSTINVKPFIRNATPDSIQRLESWISDRINFLDTEFGYVEPTGISRPVPDRQDTEVVAIYTLSGIRVEHPSRGIYIFRYRNGFSRKVLVR
jgi:hypothetical protein